MAGASISAQPAARNFRVLVTNERAGTLTVIDGASRKVVGTVPLGKRPRGLKLSPDGKLLYVALSGSPIAGPGVDEKTLPPADKGADGIGVVDIATMKLVNILRGCFRSRTACGERGWQAFVHRQRGHGPRHRAGCSDRKVITSLAVGGEPEGVTLSPNGRFIYMTSEEDHHMR